MKIFVEAQGLCDKIHSPGLGMVQRKIHMQLYQYEVLYLPDSSMVLGGVLRYLITSSLNFVCTAAST